MEVIAIAMASILLIVLCRQLALWYWKINHFLATLTAIDTRMENLIAIGKELRTIALVSQSGPIVLPINDDEESACKEEACWYCGGEHSVAMKRNHFICKRCANI